MDFEEDGIQKQPISKFYDGLDVTHECYPTECSIMNSNSDEALDSEFIKIENLALEIKQTATLG